MIQFHSQNNTTTISITVLCHQYPGRNDHYWDDNWLSMELVITQDGVHHKRQDPFLLTWECQHLAKWFHDFPNHTVDEFYMNIENTLSFTKIANDPWSQGSNLKVSIHKSLLPETSVALREAKGNRGEDDEYHFYFLLAEEDCEFISGGWAEISKQFPVIPDNVL
jgi:hypothetical protein